MDFDEGVRGRHEGGRREVRKREEAVIVGVCHVESDRELEDVDGWSFVEVGLEEVLGASSSHASASMESGGVGKAERGCRRLDQLAGWSDGDGDRDSGDCGRWEDDCVNAILNCKF